MYALSLLREAGRVLKVLSIGYSYEKLSGSNYVNGINNTPHHLSSVHSESMAIDKMKICKKAKRTKVSLLVIRITQSSTPDNFRLVNSRPCVKCLYNLYQFHNRTNYYVDKIYYSTSDSGIVMSRFNHIINEKQYVSKYYRQRSLPKKISLLFDIDDDDSD